MSKRDVVVLGAARSAVGTFGGALADTEPAELAAPGELPTLASPNGGIEVVEARVRRDNRRELDEKIRALAP